MMPELPFLTTSMPFSYLLELPWRAAVWVDKIPVIKVLGGRVGRRLVLLDQSVCAIRSFIHVTMNRLAGAQVHAIIIDP
jgi:hypothetical protein